MYKRKVSKRFFVVFGRAFCLFFACFLFQNYFENFVYKVSYEVFYDKITIIISLHNHNHSNLKDIVLYSIHKNIHITILMAYNIAKFLMFVIWLHSRTFSVVFRTFPLSPKIRKKISILV